MSKKRMKEEMKSRMEEHKVLALYEAEGINEIFTKSKILAYVYMHDTIKEFINRLENIKGPLIPSSDIEYRMFIIDLLNGIKEPFREDIIFELIKPKYNIPLKNVRNMIEEYN